MFNNNLDIYICECGCNLYFIAFNNAIQYYLKTLNNNFICIKENKIFKSYNWDDYVNHILNIRYDDFIVLITKNKNIDPVWVHLYNEYIHLIHYNIDSNSIITNTYE